MTPLERFSERGDYHQTAAYARVMESIGWDVVVVDGEFLFSRRIGPVAIAKFQRPRYVNVTHLKELKRRMHIVQLLVEPGLTLEKKPHGVDLSKLHRSYTKTLIVELSGSPDVWKKQFSPMIRRHLKGEIPIECVPFSQVDTTLMQEVLTLHGVWGKEKNVMGYDDNFLRSIVKEFQGLGWLLTAREEGGALMGAFFLLVHHGIGMYFYQFTSKLGREKHLPAQFTFEAMKQSANVGCDFFDFCSCYDERYPKENLRWQGFTKHKLLYNPLPVSYPPNFLIP